jgi:lysophospholipid acyltransferase (LPLAT)-like uncharacterized protein
MTRCNQFEGHGAEAHSDKHCFAPDVRVEDSDSTADLERAAPATNFLVRYLKGRQVSRMLADAAERDRRMMQTRSTLRRRIRFFVLEKILLPIVIIPLRILVRTWRLTLPDDAILREIGREPRPILVTYHGMFLQLLAYAYMAPAIGKCLVVMLTPSLDGRLLAAALEYFGIDYVLAAPGNRGIAGSLEFNRRIEDGGIGVIAVDGPRGPACIAQPRALDLARAANAQIYLAITSAGYGIRFRSWDRSYLPLPFARTEFRLERFSPPEIAEAGTIEHLQSAMVRTAREIKSPVVAAAIDNG